MTSSSSWIEEADAFVRGGMEYWRQVGESEGFDVEGISAPQGTLVLKVVKCEGSMFQHEYRVDLYAKLGLHRYNILKGTNFHLDHLIKYNKLMNALSSYYITLVASDPASGSVLTFQVKVDQNWLHRLNLIVSVARPKGTMEPLPLQDDLKADRVLHDLHDDDGLSAWPSEDAFNDTNRFHIMEESELLDTDWIRLYVELLLCSKDRLLRDSDLSKLKIVKVAVEASNEDVEPPSERLNAAKSATFYIPFRLAIWGIREHVERRAIVRRLISERTGNLILLDALAPFKKERRHDETLLQPSLGYSRPNGRLSRSLSPFDILPFERFKRSRSEWQDPSEN